MMILIFKLSYDLFSWMSNLLKIGRHRDLVETDLYTTLDEHIASVLGDQLEK